MRLLEWNENGDFGFAEIRSNSVPPYAVLSHIRDVGEEEVSFEDITQNRYWYKHGYEKIRFCAEQAKRDGLHYFWVDTCCIDRSNLTELAESVYVMFRWFANAKQCYVYLSDVSHHMRDLHSHEENLQDRTQRVWESQFRRAKWFTRCWTLQELLAPFALSFFSREGYFLGTRTSLASLIEDITTIPVTALHGAPLSDYSVEQRMSWAAGRQTTLLEDQAYCLLGILDVTMPLIYGEGERAFTRLRRAIEERNGGQSDVGKFISAHTWDAVASSTTVHQSNAMTLEHLRGLLYFEQMSSRQHTIRHPLSTTCEWLLQTQAYLDWMSPEKFSQHRGLLWILGKPGAGKSTLVKFAEARTSPTAEEIHASFFFNARGIALEKSALGMYRSILFQIMDKVEDSAYQTLFELLKGPQSSWTAQRLAEVLMSAVQKLGPRRVRCFIDAIDECSEQDVHDMILQFEKIGHTMEGRFYVCFASRHYPTISARYGVRLVVEDESGHDEDIDKYVHNHPWIDRGKIPDNIKTQVAKKANGVFLWARLTLNILNADCRGDTVSSVQRRLDECPNQLSNLFHDILQRGNGSHDDLLLSLQLMLFAKRPLQPREFYFAMPPGQTSRPARIIRRAHLERYILASSRGLAEVTELRRPNRVDEEPTVQFIHESVADFLLKDGGLYSLHPGFRAYPERLCHRRLSDCCQRYLMIDRNEHVPSTDRVLEASDEDAAKLRWTLNQKFPFLRYAVESLFYHANEAAKRINDDDDADVIDNDDFLSSMDIKKWVLLSNLLTKDNIHHHTDHVPLVYLLAEYNSAHLLRRYFKLGSTLPSTPHERYQHPLLVALANRHWDAVRVILRTFQNPRLEEVMEILETKADVVVRETVASPLHWALDENIVPLAELLIASSEFDLSLEDGRGQTPLSLAAKGNHYVLVKQLLSRGATHSGGMPDLYLAASKGHTRTVQQLLDSVVRSDKYADHYDIALAAAMSGGHQETARLLSDAKSRTIALRNDDWKQSTRSSSDDGMLNLESTLGTTLPTTDPIPPDTKDVSMSTGSLQEYAVEFDMRSVADTLGLGENVNAKLVSLMAKSLLDSLSKENFGDSGSSRPYKSSMQACLRSFAAMLCLPEHSSTGLDSARFIWRHHKAIVERYFEMIEDSGLEARPVAEVQREPEVSTSERTAERLDSVPSSVMESYPPIFEVPFVVGDPTHDTASEDGLALDNAEELSPELLAIEKTVTTSDAWDWLIRRMSRAHQLTYWESAVMGVFCSSLPRFTTESGMIRQATTYRVFWDPVAFLKQEFPTSRVQLKDVITVTESSGDYYACTCAEYLKMVWPSLATTFLDVLQAAIEDPSRSPMIYEIQPKTTGTIHLHKGYIIVTASGPLATVMEIGEQLTWLGSACKASCYPDRNCKSTTNVTTDSTPSSGVIGLQINYTTEPLTSEDGHGCWQKLFRYVSIATNFPIPVRESNVPGLETGLEVMVTLGETCWATVFNNRFMLKGFSSLMYPVKQAADYLIWHFVHAQNWQYLPHIAGSESCLDRVALAGGDISWLRHFRHFIAWTSDAETHMGTEGAKYNIGEPNPNSYFSNLSLQSISISASKYISVGATIGRGRHHIPLWSAPCSTYLRDMVQASQEWVLLYDADDKRAWLVDAASALLHITVAQLRVSPEARYWSKDSIQQLKYPQPGAHSGGGNPCLDTLLDKSNRNRVLFRDDIGYQKDTEQEDLEESSQAYRIQHLVHDNWKKLAQILEQHTLQPAAMELRLTTRDRLVGWSFRSMVNSKALLTPKMIYLSSEGTGQGWIDLVRNINAAILVGHGFGDIIRPSNLAAPKLCRDWLTVPTHRDYLTVTTRTLEEIAESQGCRFPDFLAKDVWWVRPRNPFLLCHCDHNRGNTQCDYAQVLASSGGKSNCFSSNDVGCGGYNAAVIFANGHGSSLSKFRKRFKPEPTGQVNRSPERNIPTDLIYDSAGQHSRTSIDATNSNSISASEEMSGQEDRSYSTLATGQRNDKDDDEDVDVDMNMANTQSPPIRSFVYTPDRPFHPAMRSSFTASTSFPSITSAKQAVSPIDRAVHDFSPRIPDSMVSEVVTTSASAQETRSSQGLEGQPLRRKRRFSAPFIQDIRSLDSAEGEK